MSLSGGTSDDEVKVDEIIKQIRSYLDRSAEEIDTAKWSDIPSSHISLLTSKLATQLLCPKSNESDNSEYDVLPILILLVQKHPTRFLVPISHAVLAQALQLHSQSKSFSTTQNTIPPLSNDILDVIIQLLTNNKTEVADNVSQALCMLCQIYGSSTTEYTIQLLTDLWKSLLNDTSKNKKDASIIFIRYASLLVSIITKCDGDSAGGGASDGPIDYAIQQSSLDLLINMIASDKEDDPLMKMTLLDLVEELATSRPMSSRRIEWVLSSKVLKPILILAGGGGGGGNDEESTGPDCMLGSQALRILSASCKVAMTETSTTFSDNNVIVAFHRSLRAFASECHGEVDRLAFIDAVSSFAFTSSDALSMILKDDEIRCLWLEFGNSQAKMKATIILSLVRLMDPFMTPQISGDDPAAYVGGEKKNMFIRLYRYLGCENSKGDTYSLLFSFARSPFAEIRIATYELFGVVSFIAPEEVLQHGDFIEFLEDCDSESTKEGKEMKYEIVKAMLRRSSDLERMPFGNVIKRLEKIASQGPHYRKSVGWEVMAE